MGVLEDLDLLQDVSGGGSHHGPLIGEGVVHFNHFVNVVELVQASQFADVAVGHNADCGFAEGHVGLGKGRPFFSL